VARGAPDRGFPYSWSVYRWLEGELAARASIGDMDAFAATLAGFLNALGRIDATGGPEPGQHNFFRGGPLAAYADAPRSTWTPAPCRAGAGGRCGTR
jgi:aminoglycoside phosphotransferase (APT) family kinase protein